MSSLSAAEIDAMIPRPRAVPPPEPAWMSEASIDPGNQGTTARRREVPPSTALPSLTWAQIIAEPPEPPPTLAQGIPKIGLTVLAGPPKVGKTLYASQTAIGVGKTTIVVEEGSLAGISWRLRKQAGALGVAEPDIQVIHRQRIRLDERGSVARLRDHVAARRPVLLILDPLNRLHGCDENRPSQMTPVMDALAGIAYDFECAVLAVHHLAKPSAERRGDVWDRFRGATSIRSGTDSNLILDGSGTSVRLYGEFRDAEPLSEYLELDREALLFRSVDAPKASGKIDPEALLALVQERGRITVLETAKHFEVKSKETARGALEALVGIDWHDDGPRGQRVYFLNGTAQ